MYFSLFFLICLLDGIVFALIMIFFFIEWLILKLWVRRRKVTYNTTTTEHVAHLNYSSNQLTKLWIKNFRIIWWLFFNYFSTWFTNHYRFSNKYHHIHSNRIHSVLLGIFFRMKFEIRINFGYSFVIVGNLPGSSNSIPSKHSWFSSFFLQYEMNSSLNIISQC